MNIDIGIDTCRRILVNVVIQTRKGQWPLYGDHFITYSGNICNEI